MTTPSGNERNDDLAAVKDLVGFCKAEGLAVAVVHVGGVCLRLHPAAEEEDPWQAMPGDDTVRTEARPDPEDIKPGDGTLDGEVAKALGVNLDAGVNDPEVFAATSTTGGDQ